MESMKTEVYRLSPYTIELTENIHSAVYCISQNTSCRSTWNVRRTVESIFSIWCNVAVLFVMCVASSLLLLVVWNLCNISSIIFIRSNKMQQYAAIYLLQNHSACFGCPSHPSSGVHKTVTAASGTGHSIWATSFLQRGLRPRWRKVVAQILWPIPEAAFTVLRTPDDGCDGHPKHVEWFFRK